MAYPPIEPFAIPATHTAPVFHRARSSRYLKGVDPCGRARTTSSNLLHEIAETVPTRGAGQDRHRTPRSTRRLLGKLGERLRGRPAARDLCRSLKGLRGARRRLQAVTEAVRALLERRQLF
jgi:hypothetical protein